MTYTNGNITRQGDRISIATPTNISRFFNTSGLVKNSFRTQNLLKKENGCSAKKINNEKRPNPSKIEQYSKLYVFNHPKTIYECLVERYMDGIHIGGWGRL